MIESLFGVLARFFQSLLSLMKILIRSNLFLSQQKVKGSKSLFILGNGPSFKTQFANHSSLIKSLDCIAVNGFTLSPYFEKVKPRYYIVCSPGFYAEGATDYNVDVRKDIINKLIENTTWPLMFYVPVQAKRNKQFVKRFEANQNIELAYYNTSPSEGMTWFNHLFFTLGWASPRPHNVMIPALLRGINAGYKHLYLLGADHSWLPQITVNENNQVLINQKHFYDEKESKPMQMQKNHTSESRGLHEVLYKFYISFKSYHILRKYAVTKSCEIYNCTESSFIDAFPRLKLEDIEVSGNES